MAEKIKFCKQCGAPRIEGAKFCKKCGYQFGASVATTKPMQAGQIINLPDASALAKPGEFALDDFVLEAIEDVLGPEAGDAVKSVSNRISSIKSPLSTLFSGLGSTITGVFKAFKQPKVLFSSAVMAVLWIMLGAQRDSDSEIINMLSWLTFSEGGFDRSALGILGGVAGKGAVAAMFGSIISGGIPKLAKGIGALFKKTEGKKSIVSLLCGILLGIIIYFIFTGINTASAITTMAGISGAVLSLEALGDKSGWLYQMAASLTAKNVQGVRTLQDGKINSLLGGLTMGFALVAAITSLW